MPIDWIPAGTSRAVKNVTAFLGPEVLDRYRVEERDTYAGIDETDLDRVVLDLPEPWQVSPHAARSLRPGGIIVAYTPTIVQAVQFRDDQVLSQLLGQAQPLTDVRQPLVEARQRGAGVGEQKQADGLRRP